MMKKILAILLATLMSATFIVFIPTVKSTGEKPDLMHWNPLGIYKIIRSSWYVHVYCKNTGPVTAYAPFSDRFYWDGEQFMQDYGHSNNIPAYTMGDYIRGFTAQQGDHELGVRLDVNGAVSESNEDNNYASETINYWWLS